MERFEIVGQLELVKNEGKTVKQARGFLAFEHSIEGKEATGLLQEAGFTTGTKGGGLTDTMAFLESEPRTEADLYNYIVENGTPNEARWIAQRNSIRLLSVSIYRKFDSDCFTEMLASADLKKAVKAMFAK